MFNYILFNKLNIFIFTSTASFCLMLLVHFDCVILMPDSFGFIFTYLNRHTYMFDEMNV